MENKNESIILIKNEYPPIGDAYPIYDGIINLEQYNNSRFRILWILKEPYDEVDESGNPMGGDWDMSEDINKKPEEYSKFKTWQRIIYCSYGILNDFKKYDLMSFYYENEMYNILRNIAVINIQKIAALSSSKDYEIEESYNKHRTFLPLQIDKINPNIIIGGNTLRYFKEEFKLNKLNFKDGPVNNYYNQDRIYIDSYHPSSWVWSEKEYVNSIIESVEMWNILYKKTLK